jgi:hypothetical protein
VVGGDIEPVGGFLSAALEIFDACDAEHRRPFAPRQRMRVSLLGLKQEDSLW